MDLENIMLSEISQSEEDYYYMISLICGIYWTNWTNKQNRDRLKDREQDDSYWGWRWEGGGIKQKKEKGLMDMDNSAVIAEGRGI